MRKLKLSEIITVSAGIDIARVDMNHLQDCMELNYKTDVLIDVPCKVKEYPQITFYRLVYPDKSQWWTEVSRSIFCNI